MFFPHFGGLGGKGRAAAAKEVHESVRHLGECRGMVHYNNFNCRHMHLKVTTETKCSIIIIHCCLHCVGMGIKPFQSEI